MPFTVATLIGAGSVGTPELAGNAVTNAKLADMATARFKLRTTAGTGDPEDGTGTQATALLDVFSATAKGLVPVASGGNLTTEFMRKDSTWAVPAGGGGGGGASPILAWAI